MTDGAKSAARGQAIVDLVAWIKSDGTAKALEALELLELSDDDLATLFKKSHIRSRCAHPFSWEVHVKNRVLTVNL